MWLGGKSVRRLRATGRLFSLNLKQLHGSMSPQRDGSAVASIADLVRQKNASHFSDLVMNFKS
jgi:hypothetical protein